MKNKIYPIKGYYYSLSYQVDIEMRGQIIERQILPIEAHVGKQVQLMSIVVQQGGVMFVSELGVSRESDEKFRVLPLGPKEHYFLTEGFLGKLSIQEQLGCEGSGVCCWFGHAMGKCRTW